MTNEHSVAENTSAHTPGPWQLHRKYPSARVVAGDFEFLQTNGKGDSPDVWLANMRLIAAAPELLEALKMAQDYLDVSLGPCEPDCECVLHPIEAAIAKAEGR